ncbi:hypothetical protein ACIOEX_11160 [Streptomyces sp. NPDC087850]|uniref:hypothetical protein n=1 Tax=Streptomyces sp. NPDC087850 TaxID=3365809 RepID=UPI00382BE197
MTTHPDITVTFTADEIGAVILATRHYREYFAANVRGVDADEFLGWSDLQPLLASMTPGPVVMPWAAHKVITRALEHLTEGHPVEQLAELTRSLRTARFDALFR